MLALTDFQTKEHHYSQSATLFQGRMELGDTRVALGDQASAEKTPEGIRVKVKTARYALDLLLKYGKGPVWHCERGYLQMGVDEPGQSTVYFSYPNMPTTGSLKLDGQERPVSGKAWFDKQGGPFRLFGRRTHWEGFSLRFFDDEEVMLFSFPQSKYQDGSYIRRDGSVSRLNQYSIKPLGFVQAQGMRFSSGWELHLPGIKQEYYTVRPLMEGQVNMAYYEQLCDVLDADGHQAGLCFVELLPGVYNEKYANLGILKRVN